MMDEKFDDTLGQMAKTAFYELVRDHEQFQKKTWNFFLPLKTKKTGDYVVIITEGRSGFASNVVFPKVHLPVLDKDIIKKIYIKSLAQVITACDKFREESKPVQHKNSPLTCGKMQSFFMKTDIVKNEDTYINYFGWKGNIIC